MKVFGEILPKDYTIENFESNATFVWRLVSSSLGTVAVEPDELETAVTILRGNSDREKFIRDNRKLNTVPVSNENGLAEHVVYSSVNQLFYNNGYFISGSDITTGSITDLADDIFVISIAQDFYGERIKPSSFEIGIDAIQQVVSDDGLGNLYISQSGDIHYVGNIFYDMGIAVVTHNTSSQVASIDEDGIKIVESSDVYVSYKSQVKNIRHEINVKLKPNDFNFPLLNRSSWETLYITGSLADEVRRLNIPEVSENTWQISNLLQFNIIKPYVTTIGLYTDRFELVAVAKLSTPIQRTFDTDQIFIVRFDV